MDWTKDADYIIIDLTQVGSVARDRVIGRQQQKVVRKPQI